MTQMWHGQIVIGATRDTIDLSGPAAGETITLTNQNVYIKKSSGGTDQLIEDMTTKVTAGDANYTGLAVTYSFATNKVTVSEDGTAASAITWTWTDTALRDLLGFTGNLTLDNDSTTATNECAFCWAPDRSLAFHPVQLNQFWSRRSTSMGQKSNDGTIVSVEGQNLNVADVAYSHIAKARVIIPSSGSINTEFQQFYGDVIHLGMPIRLYPDKTDSAVVKTLKVIDEDGLVPPLDDMISRNVQSFDNYWRVGFSCHEDV